MKWEISIRGYRSWILLERGLSKQTAMSYLSDLQYFYDYLNESGVSCTPMQVTREVLEKFLDSLSGADYSRATQSRMISSLRSYYSYLIIENLLDKNPAKLIDLPTVGRHLPDVLSVEEINRILMAVDLSKLHGERDKAILETLYGCGLRVSELTELTLSSLCFKEEYLRIIGKGNKERLVPMGTQTAKQLLRYIHMARIHQTISPGFEDSVFLNHHGKKLSRVAIFSMVKKYTLQAGITKNVSPHSFRHSFASHLIEGGADLRAVQQMLGHSSITTTEIYTHVSNRYLRDSLLTFHPLESSHEL
ncbi:MAG: site-specific tyrosine recombinase XerD [Bacteroidales bacterium]|jgi:integrase/recombinase XerD|nr:site-specific tyrosine recombinase XerD [Bacteroidales bacterium]MDD2322337.1 site-specific tyrosine recombinase XerD [Bacteroidales bacterium]MDD3009877.1 site-specific tyrosine recombinase XerD [Bacteroidales bacterium]MDD3961476.1 site-specific tyrosine recombinase XerD [Bacteroidales bacterium]MDY0285151.1 site-specific tyrosine recombinase XerD [Bacteroidales bacterium]